jgi:hypothetical protein
VLPCELCQDDGECASGDLKVIGVVEAPLSEVLKGAHWCETQQGPCRGDWTKDGLNHCEKEGK